DLDLWKNKTDTASLVPGRKKPVLLFVGNDFLRKGGEFLLEMYKRELSGNVLLQIVSNDKFFEDRLMPSGVTVHKGYSHKNLDELIELYKNADLFLYPTTADCLGLVLIEACSVGLPIIATDVGGISDVVKDGYNGYLMPYGSSQEAWVNKIKYILCDYGKLMELSGNARAYAEANFTKSSFKEKIGKALHVAMNSEK
ncbi:MAG: glycosyltransferase, partial [Candidatus Electrothrix sp. ATG1]|nr:glycosyltransferase [Candidatus Electrothrix sp. ATG1]